MEREMSVVKQIWDFEGFCIQFIEIDEDIELRQYNEDSSYINRYNGNHTLRKWKEKRFKKYYGNSKIIFLNGDGSRVPENTLVRTLRNSYNSYNPEIAYNEEHDDEE